MSTLLVSSWVLRVCHIAALLAVALCTSAPVRAQQVFAQPDLTLARIDSGSVSRIVPTSDGGALVRGYFVSANLASRQGLAKVDAAGNFVASFNVTTDGYFRDIAVAADGRIYVSGEFSRINGVARRSPARLNANGSLDTSWAVSVATSGPLLLDGAGRLYVESRRYLATGALDPGWAPGFNSSVTHLALQGDALYAAGYFSQVAGQPRNSLAKLSVSTGALDSSWNPAPSNGWYSIQCLHAVGDALYICGSVAGIGGQSHARLAKLGLSGAGTAIPGFSPAEISNVHSVLEDGGHLYIGGTFGTVGATTQKFMARLNRVTAALDAGWTPTLGATSRRDFFEDPGVFAFAVQGSRLLIGGAFDSVGGAERHALAILERSSGVLQSNVLNVYGNGIVYAIEPADDGGYYIGGEFDLLQPVRRNLLKIRADGQLDTSFVADANDLVFALARTPAGLAVGGRFTTVNASARSRLALVNPASGSAGSWNMGADAEVRALAADPSGNLYAGGAFSTLGGQPRPAIGKLATAGSGSVSSWNGSGGGYVFTLESAADGLYVGGSFNTFGGQTRKNLAKLSHTTGAALPWQLDIAGDGYALVEDIALDGSGKVYFSGIFDTVNGENRALLSRASAASGALDGWVPATSRSPYTEGLKILLDNAGSLYLGMLGGGSFSGGYASGIAKISIASAKVIPGYDAQLYGFVTALAPHPEGLLAGGDFLTARGLTRVALAGLDNGDLIFRAGFE